MKKANKAEAKEWTDRQKEMARSVEAAAEQMELLRYAAEKRKSGYPCVRTLKQLGFDESATKLRQAYNLIGDAYSLMQQGR